MEALWGELTQCRSRLLIYEQPGLLAVPSPLACQRGYIEQLIACRESHAGKPQGRGRVLLLSPKTTAGPDLPAGIEQSRPLGAEPGHGAPG